MGKEKFRSKTRVCPRACANLIGGFPAAEDGKGMVRN